MPTRSLSALLALITALTIGASATAHAAEPSRVVLIVPGQYIGALPYGPMADSLRTDGTEVQVLDLNGFDLTADAAAIDRTVAETRARRPDAKIDLVTHSIGALSARLYLKSLGGAREIGTYVSIGAAQYGSPGACGQPAAPEACPGTDFMTALNAGDDTPGPTKYYSIRSAREWADGRLDGGQCRMTPFPSLGNGGLDHALEPANPAVWQQVGQALTGDCDGDYVDEPDGAITVEAGLYPGGV
ncbi:lipase [Nocardia brasiliensis]|uniref:Lipase n=1 Tax=Nocardia brasiliensis TaxID=37326 RepID=A0A6G9XW92_NOCBR|nr:lipase [Nocardia brasiliensis]QIS05212.1 lipase [Nocardia brasiliensis]